MKFSACGVEESPTSEVLRLKFSFNKGANVCEIALDYLVTWSKILCKLNRVISGPPGEIYYIDDENDKVVLNSEDEWIEALKIAKKSKNELTLHLDKALYAPSQSPEKPKNARYVKPDEKKIKKEKIRPTNSSESKQLPMIESNDNQPPKWFDDYMSKFKDSLINEMRQIIDQRLTKAQIEDSIKIEDDRKVINKTACPFHDPTNVLLESEEKQRQCYFSLDYKYTHLYCFKCARKLESSANPCKIIRDGFMCSECTEKDRCKPSHECDVLDSDRETRWSVDSVASTTYMLKDPETGISSTRVQANNYLMDAAFLSDETVPDGTQFAPGETFCKRWRVSNTGTQAWNENTTLEYKWASNGFDPHVTEVKVPHLEPGECGTVSVGFKAPVEPGFYICHWHFVHNGQLFGHQIWCHIEVTKFKSPNTHNNETESEVLDSDEVLSAEGFVDIVQADINNITKGIEQLSFSSANPIPASKEVDIQVELLNSVTDKETNTESDVSSIAGVSSCDGDSEYVMVPMPSCFLIPGLTQNHSEVIDDAQTNSPKQESTTLSASSSVICLATESDCENDKVPAELYTHAHHKLENNVNEEQKILNTTNDAVVTSTSDLGENDETRSIANSEAGKADVAIGGAHPTSNDETENEAVVQILPDGLVEVATKLFYTARTAFNNVTRNSSLEEPSHENLRDLNNAKLKTMGFCNDQLNYAAIDKHYGNMEKIVDEVLKTYDNDWFHHRH